MGIVALRVLPRGRQLSSSPRIVVVAKGKTDIEVRAAPGALEPQLPQLPQPAWLRRRILVSPHSSASWLCIYLGRGSVARGHVPQSQSFSLSRLHDTFMSWAGGWLGCSSVGLCVRRAMRGAEG